MLVMFTDLAKDSGCPSVNSRYDHLRFHHGNDMALKVKCLGSMISRVFLVISQSVLGFFQEFIGMFYFFSGFLWELIQTFKGHFIYYNLQRFIYGCFVVLMECKKNLGVFKGLLVFFLFNGFYDFLVICQRCIGISSERQKSNISPKQSQIYRFYCVGGFNSTIFWPQVLKFVIVVLIFWWLLQILVIAGCRFVICGRYLPS